MDVVLNKVAAERLAQDVVARCAAETGDGIVTASVIALGGAVLGTSSSAGEGQMPLSLHSREIAMMAVAARGDVCELPAAWVARQPTALAPTPALSGAAVLMYVVAGGATTNDLPRLTPIGAASLMGAPSDVAYETLRTVVVDHGFALCDTALPARR